MTVLERDLADGVLTLTMNRPERRNALNTELVEALRDAFVASRTDDDVRVIVLTGAGDKAFCSGADLDPMAAAAGPYAMHRGRRAFVELLRAMRDGVPTIAKVGSHALAGGLGLVASCDLAVAADDATFGTPELRVGLFPMMIMAVIRRSLGRKHALELLMTGDRFSAADAVRMGLINRAVPRADLDAEVAKLAATLAGHSPAVMELGRDAFYAMEDMPLDAALDFLCDRLTVNTLTEDAAEGVMAFLGKRAPEWKGR